MTKGRAYAVILALFAVAALGAITQAHASAAQRSVNGRLLAAVSSARHTEAIDPIVGGTGSSPITQGTTSYFFGLSSLLSISGCHDVQIDQADGNAFDPNNSGALLVRGMDVSVVFTDSSGTPLTSFILGSLAPNGPLFSGGYSVASPQPVDFLLKDLPAGTDKVAIITEGDATNTSFSTAQTVGTFANGIIEKFCF